MTIPEAIDKAVAVRCRLHEVMEIVEKSIILRTLQRCSYNQCQTATHLGIHRNTLSRKLEIYEINVWTLKRNAPRNVQVLDTAKHNE